MILWALTWDIVTSGEITNRASRGFSRDSRALLSLGYILLLAWAVFYMFPPMYRYAGMMSGFDAEQYVVRGILALGVPFLVVAFTSRVAALVHLRQSAAASQGTVTGPSEQSS
jgi:hypothetical protein